MAYIPRPLNTSPATTMTIRQGGDLINDNFEAILDEMNFSTMPEVGGSPIVESGSNSDGEWTRWADDSPAKDKTLAHDPGDR